MGFSIELQVPLASALQGLHPHTTQAALAATIPQQTVLIQAQAQQTQATLNNALAATLAGPSANGAFGNSQQLVSIICLLIIFNFICQHFCGFFQQFFSHRIPIKIIGTTATITKEIP